MMAYPKEIKELGLTWQSVYSESDPMSFIDLLYAQAYFAGQFSNRMQIDEARTVFLTWLEKKHSPTAKSKSGDK
jgi:hypothetical protein